MSLEKEIRDLHASGISRAQAAHKLGLTVDKFGAILQTGGWNLRWKRTPTGGKHTIDGVTDTLSGHAARYGITIGTLRGRLERKEDLKAPPSVAAMVTEEEARKFTELRREGVPAWAAAELVGRPYNTLKNAAKKFCPDYQSVIEEAPRIRRSGDNSSVYEDDTQAA